MSKLLKNKNFIRIWTSQLLSQVTVNLINFLLILRVYETTHSGVMVALVSFFWTVPTIILAPFSGVIVDLVDKRKILLYTNFIQAFIVLLYLGVENRVWPIYSVVFIYSIINQFYMPAESSSLPALVKKDFYPTANGLFLFTANITFLVGYTLAGPVIRLMGKQIPYLVGSVALIIATYAVYRLPKDYSTGIKNVRKLEDFFDRLKEGYLFIKDHKYVLYPIILIALSQIILNLMVVVIPLYAEKILHLDLRDSALILITPAGIGALIGLRLIILEIKRGIRKHKLIFGGLIMSAFCFLMLSMVIPYLLNFKLLITFLTAVVLGISFSSLVIPSQTLIQENTPKDLLGRTYSSLSFVITISYLIPLMLMATLADILGVKWILLIFSGAIIIITLGAFKYMKINYDR